MKKETIQLEILTCPSCVKRIETAVNRVIGVESAQVLFTSSKVKVIYDEVITNLENIKKSIIKLGYSLSV